MKVWMPYNVECPPMTSILLKCGSAPKVHSNICRSIGLEEGAKKPQPNYLSPQFNGHKNLIAF